ncbi:MAG: DUF721 domain-containing protein [Rhodocyclales bacterium]|nr:DUF721 domain-containing protein [Rhodocyclales bacterium]
MSHSPQPLNNYLSDSDGAGRLMAHVALLRKLARIYANTAPEHLGQASRVANYKSGTVVIHADNGAVAVKLRQMAPTLAREFSNRGVECSGVQVKVQALEISGHSKPAVHRPLSSRTGDELAALAGGMRASPLRDAIETLLRRAAREK